MILGFIGCGAMGGAILKGLLKKQYMPTDNIYITTHDFELTEKIADDLKVTPCKTNIELAEKCDVIILAVKPFAITSVIKEIEHVLINKKPIVVSIAAGTSIEKIYGDNANAYPLIRVMPNIGARLSISTTALFGSETVNDEQIKIVQNIFNQVGTTTVLEHEKQFSAFVGISGSSPAFTFMFIEGMAKAANEYGIDKKTALKISSNAVKGASILVEDALKNGLSVGQLIDELCTAGGTTISGLLAAEEYGLSNAIIKAVSATTEKDQTLNKEN